MSEFDAVLFDLDGTLVDTRSASWPWFERTSREFALGIDTREQFFALFEGNFFESLARHCGDHDKAAAAAQHFMALIRDHYEPPFIDGIAEVVREIAARHTLAIISSNMHETIGRLLHAGGLATHFAHIYAGDTQPSKCAAIADFLAGRWSDSGAGRQFEASRVVLITDTAGDVGEAVASGIRAFGVEWGMHDRQKLIAAGAAQVASQPQQLLQWIN